MVWVEISTLLCLGKYRSLGSNYYFVKVPSSLYFTRITTQLRLEDNHGQGKKNTNKTMFSHSWKHVLKSNDLLTYPSTSASSLCGLCRCIIFSPDFLLCYRHNYYILYCHYVIFSQTLNRFCVQCFVQWESFVLLIGNRCFCIFFLFACVLLVYNLSE